MIGTLLGIPNEELKIIEASYPTNLKWCCNQMLAKWIEIDPTASFEKLFAAIHSSAVSGLHKDNGNHQYLVCKIILLKPLKYGLEIGRLFINCYHWASPSKLCSKFVLTKTCLAESC